MAKFWIVTFKYSPVELMHLHERKICERMIAFHVCVVGSSWNGKSLIPVEQILSCFSEKPSTGKQEHNGGPSKEKKKKNEIYVEYSKYIYSPENHHLDSYVLKVCPAMATIQM